MLQAAGDLRLQHKAAATGLVMGMAFLDLFQGDFPVQFLILRPASEPS
jgi:hypothetical protein